MEWILDTMLQPAGAAGPTGNPAVSVSGATIAVAWPMALDVYTLSAGQWNGMRILSGISCKSVVVQGDTLALGAEGKVRMFSRTNGTWSATQTLLAPAVETPVEFGACLALSGDTLAVGDPSLNDNVGQVVVFERVAGVWSASPAVIASIPDAHECYTTPADQHFGSAVALTSFVAGMNQVDRLVVGKPGAGQACAKYHDAHPGHAYVFERTNQGPWTLTASLVSPQATPGGNFGSAVIAQGNTIVVAGRGEINGFLVDINGTWNSTFVRTGADLQIPLGFDGKTLAFGSNDEIDPYTAESGGVFSPEAVVSASPGGTLCTVSVEGNVMAAGDTQSTSVFVFRPGVKPKTGYWAAINPLVLVLGDQAFVRLTLPDPPPDIVLIEQLRSSIKAMTARQRTAAAKTIGATAALLSRIQTMLKTE